MEVKKDLVIVTGSNGLIGYAAAARLAGEGYEVVGFDRQAPSPPPPGCTAVPVDLTSDESVREGLRVIREHHGTHIASVIHLAAYYDFSGEPSPKYEEITVRGTERLLRGLKDFQVEQFVFSSTMLVHLPREPGEFINEDSPIKPTWAYPNSKIETEELIRSERGSIPVVLLRIAGVYDDQTHSIPLAHQIQRIYERWLTSRVFPGDVAHGQSFLHLDDLVDVFARLVERRKQLPPELPLLAGEPEPLTYSELQHTFGRLIHGEDWETTQIPKALAKTGAWFQDNTPLVEEPFIKPWMIDYADDHYALDISRAKQLLDWTPQRSLRGTLPKMIDALKTDPAAWYEENKLEPPSELENPAQEDAINEHKNHSSEKESGATMPENQYENAPASDEAKINEGQTEMTHDTPKEGESEKMPGMSDEEHAKMMEGKSADEHSKTMSHGDMNMSGGMMQGMGGGDHDRMMWQESLWASFVNLILGAWLITSPATLGYQSAGMTWSDIVSGSLIVVFSIAAASRKIGNYARWANCFVGIWLLFAPLVFWSPTAAGYMNDTIIGALVIAFSVLVPMMPGMDMSVMDGADVPPGWSYNPSSWLQRAPIILLALVGFLASRYMAAYQLGHVDSVYDPFFGDGTRTVLESDISKMFPISDAGLGALAYMLEILMGFMGDKARWRTMPWMVTFFGILVIPLGTVSIVLIILQPLAVGAWCSLCLLAAIAMLAMIPATLDEVVAMLQFLLQAKREGKPLWRTFWLGGTVEGKQDSGLTPFDWSRPFEMFQTWIVSNWNLLVCSALGVWLMFAPWFFQTTGRAADSDHLVGALIVTFAVIAMAEVGRAVRFINVLFGIWLVIAPFVLNGFTTGAIINGIIAGIVLILLSFPRGKIRENYGGWNDYIV